MKRTTKTCSRLLRLSIIIFLGLITVSCATTGNKEKKIKKSLKVVVEAFNSDIRWQDFQSAEAFVPKDQKERYWAEMDRMKHNIRLTDFDVRDIEYSHQGRLARVMVRFNYWRLDSPILTGVTLTQTWRYYKVHKEGMWKVSDYGFEALPGISSGH